MTKRLTVRVALRRYDLPMLTAMAEVRGLAAARGGLMMTQLQDTLTADILNSDRLRDCLTEAPDTVREGIGALVQAEGRLPAGFFQEQYGEIRRFGSAQFVAIAPWRDLANVSEWLYYFGLVYFNVAETSHGLVEFIEIPSDLAPFFEITPVRSVDPAAFRYVRPASPTESQGVQTSAGDFYDLACLMLAGGRIGKSFAPIEAAYGAERVEFCARLLSYCGLSVAESFGTTDDGERIQQFLMSDADIGVTMLFRAWVDSYTEANDQDEFLSYPGFQVDPTFRIDASSVRKRIVGFLDRLDADAGWLSFRSFLTTIRTVEPNFFRNLVYTPRWMIANHDFVEPFGWDAIEGTVLTIVFRGALTHMGIIDLAIPDGSDGIEIGAFRITPLGRRVLSRFFDRDVTPIRKRTGLPVVTIDGKVRVKSDVPAITAYHLARFGDWEEIRPDRWAFRLTPASLRLAKEKGLKIRGLTGMLRRSMGKRLPLKLVESLETWDRNETEAMIYTAILVSDADPNRIDALVKSRDCSRWIEQRLNPTTLVIKQRGIAAVRRKLAEIGVLTDVSGLEMLDEEEKSGGAKS